MRYVAFFLTAVAMSAAQSADIIVDNTDGVGVVVQGAWKSTQDVRKVNLPESLSGDDQPSSPRQHYGTEYLHDRGEGKGTKQVRFKGELPGRGRYEVFLWWTSGADRAGQVPVTVQHAEGTTEVLVDQRTGGGRWNSLGVYNIASRSDGAVAIRNRNTEGLVVADAIRYSLVGPLQPFPPTKRTPPTALSFASPKQLLSDDFLVEAKEGVNRTWGTPKKVKGGAPIFTASEPWEDNGSFGIVGSVDYNAASDCFRLWYWPRRYEHAYAKSKDGINWIRPRVGLKEWNGSRDNNLISVDVGKQFTVYDDPAERDAAHRFKGVGDSREYSQSRLYYSADGLSWKAYNDGKPVTYRAADFTNQILWDPARNAYLLLTRTDYGTSGGEKEIRGMRTMVNPDPKHDPSGWRTTKSWFLDGAGDLPARRQLYFFIDTIHAGVHFC